MVDQLPLLGGAGLAVFAAVIFYLLRAMAVYRADHRADYRAWQLRYGAEIEAGKLRLDAEISSHARTQEMLDAERERRRVAENIAWAATREAAPQLEKLRTEVVQLRKTVTGDVDDDAR